MESVNPLSRFRYWWASHLPPLKRPSPTRFFIWLAFFAASGAAFVTLSAAWGMVGVLLLMAGDVALDGLRPARIKPAAKLTSRELCFLIAAAVLIMVALFYVSVGSPTFIPALSPPVARVVIAVLWVAVIAYQSRRTFGSPSVRSA